MDRVVRSVFLIVVLILFASGLIAFYTIFMRDVIVPDFRERSIVDAVAEAEKLELVFQIEPVAGNMPDGIVLAQYPAAGEQMRKGQVVILQVSRTGEMKTVPELRKKTLAAAQKQIQASGFILGDVLRISQQGYMPGTVISQNPAPPEKMMPGRKIDLLVQEGNATDNIIVPDVNRKNETEARKILEASGLKVQGVERAYSPVVPEGLVIETKPVAGTSIKPSQPIVLKLATQKRPAGYLDESTKTNAGATGTGTVRRVTSQPAQNQNQTPAKPNTPAANTPAQPAKNNTPTTTPAQPAKTSNNPEVMNAPAEPKPVPSNNNKAPAQQQTQNKNQPSNSNSKTARVRYQVPPLSSPMNLRIELTDPKGKRDILNRQVRSGESVSVQAQYSQECVISIYLGGEFVWQERQR